VAIEGEAIDIPTMREMPLEEYREYLRSGLFFVDHHNVLRSGIGEFPIATTREQFTALMEHLASFVNRVGEEG
jgi:hypothetical protein